MLVVRSSFVEVSGSVALMRVTRIRAFALLTIALLWAVTPAMACGVLRGATMTSAERECCHHMAEQCGSSMMPASHSCCKAQGPTNTVLPQALTAGPVRPPHNRGDTAGRHVRGVACGGSEFTSFVSSCPTSRTISRL